METAATKILPVLVLACVAASAVCAQAPGRSTAAALEQARALEQAHDLDGAKAILRELIRRDPVDADALIELGEVQLAQGLNEDALNSFEAVLRQFPDSPRARDGEVRAAEAAALGDRGAGIDGSALVCLVRARKFVPDSPRLLFDFGMQAESMRIYGDADEALNQAHKLVPEDTKILYALAHVELDEQKMPQAEEHLRAYLHARPDDSTAHYGLGHLLHMLLREDEATSELERSIALVPRQTNSYYELGDIALERGDNEAAQQRYRQVLTLAPNHGGALTGMGIVEFRAKDYAAAEKYLKSAIEHAPDYATAHHYYALLLRHLGRQAESKREAEIADELNKTDVKERRGNVMTVIE